MRRERVGHARVGGGDATKAPRQRPQAPPPPAPCLATSAVRWLISAWALRTAPPKAMASAPRMKMLTTASRLDMLVRSARDLPYTIPPPVLVIAAQAVIAGDVRAAGPPPRVLGGL